MDQHTETLHERASEHYLNGRFQEALEAWRELQRLDPEDERAIEGLRLCGIMNDSEDLGSAKGSAEVDSTEPQDPPAAQAGPAPAAPATAATDEVADLDFDLSVLDSAPAAPSPSAALPDPDRQNEGIDLGEEPVGLVPVEPDNLDRPSGYPPVRAAEAAVAPGQPAASLATAPASDPIEDQLNRRVRDLLNDARAAADQGDREEALSILSRVAILDEENNEASELEAALRSEISQSAQEIDHWLTEGVQWIEEGRFEEAVERFKRVLEQSPDHREARAYLEQAEQRLAGGGAGSEEVAAAQGESLIAPLLDPPETSAAQPAGEIAPPTVALAREGSEDTPLVDLPPMEPVPVPSGPSKRQVRPQAKLAVLVVLILVVGGVGWLLFGGGDGPGASGADFGATATAPPSPAGDAGSGDAVHAAGAPTGPASNIERAEGVAAAMRRASNARSRGDFEEAILAYNEALSLDPDNRAAREGLFQAGEIFRERRALNDQLRKARIAFEDGEYTAALRLFYRLPDDSIDDATLTRYKVNGWINLGILGLKAGDTERAIESLGDALELSNNHPEALRLMAFAEAHHDTATARSYYVEVNALEFVGLDD